jgi:uncharacterized protein YndB with AHSA1/START domain
MSINQELAPLVKTVRVPTSPERAFELFTKDMSAWWPLRTHSIGEEKATEVRFEGAVGGRIVEYGDDGPLGYWGTVSDWDPPQTVSFTWHPGSDPKQAGHITVTFRPVDGGTEVELTHTGWERRPDGAEARESYVSGWDYVLDFYMTHSR